MNKIFTPLGEFIHKQTTASTLLLLATIIAITLANTPWYAAINHLINSKAGIYLHEWSFSMPLNEWVGSGLMALFFFLIGLEVKREVLAGRLRDAGQVRLIILAALGGMVVPGLLYLIFNYNTASAHGWAIPMATDTAFAIGVLAVMARRVSYGASIFLAAMAIFDDIGAMMVISFFYGHDLQLIPLIFSAIILSLLCGVNLMGMRSGWIYLVLGITLWLCIYHSGLHATLAGMLMAAVTPARAHIGEARFVEKIRALLSTFEAGQRSGVKILGAPGQHAVAGTIQSSLMEVSTPLQRWETSLITPIGIIVLPLFALMHAGMPLTIDVITNAFLSPVTQGILAGLVIGKPLGVVLFTYIGLRMRIGILPQGMYFSEVVTCGMLAGIGFTMSLFITMLSFNHQLDVAGMVRDAKIGILLGSLLSAICTCVWILYKTKKLLNEPLVVNPQFRVQPIS